MHGRSAAAGSLDGDEPGVLEFAQSALPRAINDAGLRGAVCAGHKRDAAVIGVARKDDCHLARGWAACVELIGDGFDVPEPRIAIDGGHRTAYPLT